MRCPKAIATVVIVVLVLIVPSIAHGWNYTGHKTIASIAYRQLDEQTKQRIADVLRKHPAYADLWANRAGNGPDDVLNLLQNASLFPDDARRGPWSKYNRPAAHYVNFRILAGQGNKVEQPLDGENVINSYVAHLRKIRDPKTPVEDKALHLSWVFHQA
jgi:S1/P1 Nuclease